jgi:hypothetical protein
MKNMIVKLWLFFSAFFPLVAVWLPFFVTNASRTHPLTLSEELFPLIFGSLLVAAPFVILAIWTRKKLTGIESVNRKAIIISGIVVLIIYSALVCWILFDTFTRKSGGANIGGGVLLFTAPFILPLIMIATYQILRKK